MQLELLCDAKARLGEGPVWDSRSQLIYWLDILDKRIYAGPELLLELNDVVGSIAPRQSGGFILALSGNEGGFSFASLEVDSSGNDGGDCVQTTLSTTGSWQYGEIYGVEITTGTSGGPRFINNSNTVAAEFYIDDGAVQEV